MINSYHRHQSALCGAVVERQTWHLKGKSSIPVGGKKYFPHFIDIFIETSQIKKIFMLFFLKKQQKNFFDLWCFNENVNKMCKKFFAPNGNRTFAFQMSSLAFNHCATKLTLMKAIKIDHYGTLKCRNRSFVANLM